MEKLGRVSIRMDKSIKDEAERILKSMGLSPAMAIDIFYRQIIFQRKMPFGIKCPDPREYPRAFSSTGESFSGS